MCLDQTGMGVFAGTGPLATEGPLHLGGRQHRVMGAGSPLASLSCSTHDVWDLNDYDRTGHNDRQLLWLTCAEKRPNAIR